jgi:hypothetical protein
MFVVTATPASVRQAKPAPSGAQLRNVEVKRAPTADSQDIKLMSRVFLVDDERTAPELSFLLADIRATEPRR